MDLSKHQLNVNLETLNERTDAMLRELTELVDLIQGFLKASNPENVMQQLKAVSESVRKLEKHGIPVPDDLRRLKITLASYEFKVDEIERVQAKIVRDLNHALSRLGTPTYSTPQPAGKQSPRRGKKSQSAEAKGIDLFSWKAEGRNN